MAELQPTDNTELVTVHSLLHRIFSAYENSPEKSVRVLDDGTFQIVYDLQLVDQNGKILTISLPELADNYGIIFPSELPASKKYFAIDENGVITFETPSGGSTNLTVYPTYQGIEGGLPAAVYFTLNDNTTAKVGLITVPVDITINQLNFYANVGTVGELNIAIYSNDGQTKLLDTTTGELTASGKQSKTLASPITLPAGNYYILVMQDPADCRLGPMFFNTYSNNYNLTTVAGKPVMEGTLNVTAGTTPATIDPTAITEGEKCTMTIRLDN